MLRHVFANPLHRAGHALAPSLKAGEQPRVAHGIVAERLKLDVSGLRVDAGLSQELVYHAR